MKKVLILVVSVQTPPYGKMIDTSLQTWDSVAVDGVETVFYCSRPKQFNTDKIIYIDVDESYFTMGYKMLAAFDWAMANKEFDYIARVNASCYVDKKQLINYVQSLPDKNVFACLEVAATETEQKWSWGGGQFILSKDIVELILKNRNAWNHSIMEDKAIGHLMNFLNVPYTQGTACSIDKMDGDKWRCMSYGSESFEFTNFADIAKKSKNHFYRVKQDYDRSMDEYVMNELYKNLNK